MAGVPKLAWSRLKKAVSGCLPNSAICQVIPFPVMKGCSSLCSQDHSVRHEVKREQTTEDEIEKEEREKRERATQESERERDSLREIDA